MAKNDQKFDFLGKWQENGVIIAWSSFLSVDFIVTIPNDNIYVNKKGGGIKGSSMSRHKWSKIAKMRKNSIFWQMAGKWSGNSL